jgi:predicted ATPase
MVRALVLGGEASDKAGRIREAATYYLRAGRSAFLQDQFDDDAQKWLNRAVQLANTTGEDQIIQEARSFLRQIEALTATTPKGSGKKATPAE